MLLWHGSRLTNFVGILSHGLRIAPPEAPTTGYMFGKGIYFADLVSKSAQYCYTTDENPVGLMLLSEVALGEVYKLKKATVSFTMMHICLCLNSVHAFPSPCAWFELTTSQYVRVLHVKESLLFSYGH